MDIFGEKERLLKEYIEILEEANNSKKEPERMVKAAYVAGMKLKLMQLKVL